MDEMRLKLSTKFMRGIVAKLISKAIRKKLGCDIYVQLNEISVRAEDGNIYIHADVDAETDNENLAKLVKLINED